MHNGPNLNGYGFGVTSELQNAAGLTYLPGNDDIDFRNIGSQPSLHAAILYGTEADVNSLLSSGASVSTWNSRENQPLHEAIIKGDVSIIKLLLKYGANVNSVGFEGKTPLHLATSSQEVMELLLKKRPAVSLQDHAGNTPLHLLLQLESFWESKGVKASINVLLSSGAEVNITNNASETPLHLLVSQVSPNSKEQLRILLNFLEYNPDVSLPAPNGSLPFGTLLRKLSPDLTREAVWRRRNYEDDKGLERGCLKRFLSLGADADSIVIDSRPLLHYCLEQGIFMGRFGAAENLLMHIFHRANVNLAGGDGNYPIHHLLVKSSYTFSTGTYSKLDYINVLIDKRANMNQVNATGICPMEILLSNKNETGTDLIKYAMALLKGGATSMRLMSTGKSRFNLVEERTQADVRHNLIKALLEADLAFKHELSELTGFPIWAGRWREACNEPQWIVAKHLLRFEDITPGLLSKEFLDCAFMVVAEKLLNRHKDQLVLWQAGRLEKEVARPHRKEYVAILKDCNERQAAIEPSWYMYLLEIMDFD